MGNIFIAIKRFFQNKNTVTIFAILVAVGIIYFAYNYRIKKSTEPVNVPYATKEIGPRTNITSDMVATRKVPGGVVTKDVITNSQNIIGKYVSNKAVIPEGSMFYSSMVIEWDELPSSIAEDIGNGETIYALDVSRGDDKTFGNSIYPGNYIDIYYKANYKMNNRNVPWIGKFIEGIQVLDVVDENNNSVFETNGAPLKPKKIIFNINNDMYLLFMKIDILNIDLFPVQRNANYSKQQHGAKIVDSDFKLWIEGQAIEDNIVIGGKK